MRNDQWIEAIEGLAVFKAVRGTKAVRGITAAAVLMAGLAACGSGGGDGKGGAQASGGTGGTVQERPIVLTEDQVRTALVGKAGAPTGWEGTSPKIDDPGDALNRCQEATKTNCGGFLARGRSYFRQEKANEQGGVGEVKFTVYAFRTPDDAKAALKGLAATERRKAGSAAKPLKVEAGADETDAFTGKTTEIGMRVGAVLVRLESIDLREGQPYADFAKLQIDRIKKTAQGKNPDA
ncbi:hypothetical protein [Streptomyces sp. MST-110588]|uniref:hypothetical protein n=1 Tax=Streptomyces sp. MST-110588 TaxID=2833628 RepID=UPI001F5C3225|nr:hypothetical protein [Streptomyces sp. MST-110588]UNO42320.1 hypothetical protein KGS77_25840 [Streptomyces sp. MST-110588]